MDDGITQNLISLLQKRAYNLRVLSLEATTAAGSGHPTSCLSAADIVAALFFHVMRQDLSDPDNPANDRFILSKGHAAPVLYAAYEQLGVISKKELLTLRSFDSVLEGHPTPRFAYTEVATGSLGCGLSNGLGMALSARLNSEQFYTYVLLGDSEMAEGSVWEAAEIASFYDVDTLIAFVDLNRLGQTTETLDDHNLKKHEARWRAFGWETFTIAGHNMAQILKACDAARQVRGKPSVIIACTIKGYGLTCCEDKEGYHGKAFSKEELPCMLTELKDRFPGDAGYDFEPEVKKLHLHTKRNVPQYLMPRSPYKQGALFPTRKAFGEALAAAGAVAPELVSLDAEVKNSTFAEIFEHAFPDRFFQCFIAEQNMIGMAAGFAARHFIPFSSTFASFITRAHDQLRMAAISRLPLRVAGSHAGVSIGQDGPSQMGLEDIGLMRALPNSIVLYPADATTTHALVGLMINYHEGISYLRLTRSETPVLYDSSEPFRIGGCKVVRETAADSVCIIAAGITLFEALKAHDALKERGVYVSIIDAYSIKPLDEETIIAQVLKAHKHVITVEDHYRQGGLGEAVCYALRNAGCRIEVLAVEMLPRSGKPQELLAYHRIDHTAIIETVYSMIV